ncbi:MAG: UTP--glucose-1-phosphate uridylyltransferase [Firmicutes bacterium ADurb.Bin080]|jgi:UTP--glucose-1-phosphate uridylyltransferase|nr:NTP transferase domain-containing protein [Clostridiales bacterium]OQC12121.1 MAG: UTP--glucose-1-phosphate uridylyltransferase [Firmicutes bacterium ADurb.Bin080]
MKIVRKAVIPAAGYGTRFLPITKGIPKEMLPIYDKPTLHYIVKEAVDSGCTDILIIVSEGKEAIKKYFAKEGPYDAIKDRKRLYEIDELVSKANISYVTQKVLNGNGAAVQLAKNFTGDDPFVVMFGDDVIRSRTDPCSRQLIDAFQNTGKVVLGVQERPDSEAILYGVVKKGKTEGRYTEVLGIVEKPQLSALPSNLCSLGRFVLIPEIYDALANTETHFGEIYLTDAISALVKENKVVAYTFEGERFDLGNKFGFLQANISFGLEGEYQKRLLEYMKKTILENE